MYFRNKNGQKFPKNHKGPPLYKIMKSEPNRVAEPNRTEPNLFAPNRTELRTEPEVRDIPSVNLFIFCFFFRKKTQKKLFSANNVLSPFRLGKLELK